MREILFRGKRLDNGEWVQGYLFCIWGKAYICWGTINDVPDMKEVDPETVCQYIGLTDRHGRKIFEGDIIRHTNEIIRIEEVVEIKYNELYAGFCMILKSEMGLQYLSINKVIASSCEVIGNTFDNPELLDGSSFAENSTS